MRGPHMSTSGNQDRRHPHQGRRPGKKAKGRKKRGARRGRRYSSPLSDALFGR